MRLSQCRGVLSGNGDVSSNPTQTFNTSKQGAIPYRPLKGVIFGKILRKVFPLPALKKDRFGGNFAGGIRRAQ